MFSIPPATMLPSHRRKIYKSDWLKLQQDMKVDPYVIYDVVEDPIQSVDRGNIAYPIHKKRVIDGNETHYEGYNFFCSQCGRVVPIDVDMPEYALGSTAVQGWSLVWKWCHYCGRKHDWGDVMAQRYPKSGGGVNANAAYSSNLPHTRNKRIAVSKSQSAPRARRKRDICCMKNEAGVLRQFTL